MRRNLLALGGAALAALFSVDRWTVSLEAG